MGWEEAETFRLSSLTAATQLNGLKCFKLERPQPHNLVTCQPRHVAIVVAVGEKLCDRSTQIQFQLPKEGRKRDQLNITRRVPWDNYDFCTYYFYYTRCIGEYMVVTRQMRGLLLCALR